MYIYAITNKYQHFTFQLNEIMKNKIISSFILNIKSYNYLKYHKFSKLLFCNVKYCYIESTIKNKKVYINLNQCNMLANKNVLLKIYIFKKKFFQLLKNKEIKILFYLK